MTTYKIIHPPLEFESNETLLSLVNRELAQQPALALFVEKNSAELLFTSTRWICVYCEKVLKRLLHLECLQVLSRF